MALIYSACPVVKKTLEHFTELVSVGCGVKRIGFSEDVFWLQESSSQSIWMHGGKVLKEGATFSDFCGYLSSFDQSVIEPEKIASGFSVTEDSSLVLVVATKVYLTPVLQTANNISYNMQCGRRNLQYTEIPYTWKKESYGDNGEIRHISLGSQLLCEQVTWSSKNTPLQNAKIADDFRSKWSLGN